MMSSVNQAIRASLGLGIFLEAHGAPSASVGQYNVQCACMIFVHFFRVLNPSQNRYSCIMAFQLYTNE